MPNRPPALFLEGCVIEMIQHAPAAVEPRRSLGRVIAVEGPWPPDPHRPWPDIGGWTIVYQEEPARPGNGGSRWINQVHVENGHIFAYKWRDEILDVERPDKPVPVQLALF